MIGRGRRQRNKKKTMGPNASWVEFMNSMAVYSGKLPSFFSINVFIQSFIQPREAVASAPPEEVCKIDVLEAYRSSVVRSGVEVFPVGRLDNVE